MMRQKLDVHSQKSPKKGEYEFGVMTSLTMMGSTRIMSVSQRVRKKTPKMNMGRRHGVGVDVCLFLAFINLLYDKLTV